ncbi:transposase [Tateyamaria sp. syn59]|uniref:transposase n=1 Tax=Tateyamaria sp. syn59 TaxID=2576942 RepID=UPI0011BEA92B|nr:transposase [Tateyamaria sp. syn59]
MARKRHSDEDILKLLREIELKLAAGDDVASACRSVGISDATYYNWRKRFGGMGRAQLSELKSLENWSRLSKRSGGSFVRRNNARLKKNEPFVRHWSEDNRRMLSLNWTSSSSGKV